MIVQYILRAVKSFFGLQNDHRSSATRKRPLYRLDFEVSDDDDDSDYEPDSPKRMKVGDYDVEVESSSSLQSMADWVRPRRGFSQSYYYATQQPTVASKPLEPKVITLSDDSADESVQVVDVPADEPWDWKCSQNSSRSREYVSSRRNEKLARQTKATPKRKGDAAEVLVAQPHHFASSQTLAHRVENGPDQIIANGHGHQVRSLSGRCEHVCSVHSKPTRSHRKKRGSTAAECFRLEDKERYRLLLQQYSASTNPLFGYNGQSKSTKKLTSKPTPTDVLKDVHTPEVQVLKDKSKRWTSSGRALVKEKLSETHQQYHTRSILLKSHRSEIQKTLRQEPQSSPEVEIIETESSRLSPISQPMKRRPKAESPASKEEAEQRFKSDDSVVITKEIIVPKWKQTLVNMGGYEYSSPDWLKEWKKKLAEEREEKRRQIEAAKENAKTLEKNLETMVSKLHLSTTEVLPEIIAEEFRLDEEEEEVEPLPEITPEMEEKIDDAFCPTPPDELLVEGFRLQIRRRDMETLQDLNWLNDEVINFYMNLLMERGKADNMPSVYAVNTFFYPKLISGGHDALKRWTRKIDVFAHEIMLVPVHLGVHWCLAVVNFKDKTLIYYDSMGGNNNECLNALSDYLQAESVDKKKKPFDMTDWSIKNAKDIPQQMNSSDCGMFACKYAEYITRNAKITFKQEHMPYFRRRMVYEIITKRLL